jgi:hypothetical protein
LIAGLEGANQSGIRATGGKAEAAGPYKGHAEEEAGEGFSDHLEWWDDGGVGSGIVDDAIEALGGVQGFQLHRFRP